MKDEATIHNLHLALLHRYNRQVQDPDLSAILDDLQIAEDWTNGERTEEECREAIDRLKRDISAIFGFTKEED